MASRQNRMTDVERARIVRLHKTGLSYVALKERFGCTYDTVAKIVQKAKKAANAQG